MYRRQESRSLRPAFTLLEMIIAFAVIATVIGLLVVWVGAMREKSNRVTCQTHLKNLSLAVHLHHDVKGVMPPYASGKGSDIFGGWFIHLLPHMGHLEIYDRISDRHTARINGTQLFGPGRSSVHGVAFPELRCPSDPTRAHNDQPRTNYLANWYALTDEKKGAYGKPQPFRRLTDGLSHVVLFAEGYSQCQTLPRLALFSHPYHNFGLTQTGLPSDDPSYAPTDYTMFQIKPKDCDKQRTQTAHSAMPIALADGTSRFVSGFIKVETWKMVLKPRDGNPDEDW